MKCLLSHALLFKTLNCSQLSLFMSLNVSVALNVTTFRPISDKMKTSKLLRKRRKASVQRRWECTESHVWNLSLLSNFTFLQLQRFSHITARSMKWFGLPETWVRVKRSLNKLDYQKKRSLFPEGSNDGPQPKRRFLVQQISADIYCSVWFLCVKMFLTFPSQGFFFVAFFPEHASQPVYHSIYLNVK